MHQASICRLLISCLLRYPRVSSLSGPTSSLCLVVHLRTRISDPACVEAGARRWGRIRRRKRRNFGNAMVEMCRVLKQQAPDRPHRSTLADVEVTEDSISAKPFHQILQSHKSRYFMLCEPEWLRIMTVRSITGTSAITNKVNCRVFTGEMEVEPSSYSTWPPMYYPGGSYLEPFEVGTAGIAEFAGGSPYADIYIFLENQLRILQSCINQTRQRRPPIGSVCVSYLPDLAWKQGHLW